jgi:hypothetical protein
MCQFLLLIYVDAPGDRSSGLLTIFFPWMPHAAVAESLETGMSENCSEM